MSLTESQTRYVNFYTDFAFKKLFGTEVNKDLLISFLNSLFDGKEVIEDLQYLNAEHLGHAMAERKAVFDVYCKNDKGEKFLIEMQKAEQSYFIDRSIYYSTFPIQEQAPKGKWNFELKRVYTIGILNFIFNEKDPNYMHHEVKLMEINKKEIFFDKLTYIYLEMPKFRKEKSELVTVFDKWLYAIKHLGDLEERPAELKEAIFKRLFEQAEIANFTAEERYDYRESQKNFWDLNNVIETAEMKGRVKGIAEGRAEGIAEGEYNKALDIARNLKSYGMPMSQIIAMTGLSEDDINVL